MSNEDLKDLFGVADDKTSDAENDFDEPAQQLFLQYTSYIKAGFTPVKAMQIILTILSATIQRGNDNSGLPPVSF